MRKRGFIFIIFCAFFYRLSFAQRERQLSFGKDSKFTIVQFTDLHIGDKNQELTRKTLKTIKYVISKEKPDLVVLTGDVVTSPPIKKGWQKVSEILEDIQVPWAVALGNHDGKDAGIKRSKVFTLIEDSSFFIGKKGTESSGVGNYALPIKGSTKDEPASIIYIFDSHNTPIDKKYGHWDWIKDDQIQWYKQLSSNYTSTSKGKVLPSIAFFHIPLPEFNYISKDINTIGNKKESVSSPDINSGLFSSFIEKGDVIGVFTGHDHNNDYIGINYGIALGYGRATGEEAYGDLERGGRIIKLYETPMTII